jgi:uncharacterized membrane protein
LERRIAGRSINLVCYISPELRSLHAICGLNLDDSGIDIQVFFLGCVLIAGLYGAATASRKILYVQAVPAAIGLVLVFTSSVVGT